jgi:predicted nucleotidyltransferase
MGTDSQADLVIPKKAIERICARYRVRELALFGSAVKGPLRPDSDVDLLVVLEPDARIGLVALARLQGELADAFGRRIDLVPRDGLKAALRSEVLAGARTLYAA